MPLDRIVEFRRGLQRDIAESVVPTAHGTACLSGSIPQVYDHNFVSVEEGRVGAAELAADADEALAAHTHRRVIVESATPGLAADFASLGYVLSTHLVLEHRREPDRLVDTSVVREASLEELLPGRTDATIREPWGDAEIARQLNDAKRHIAAAVPTRFFAATIGDQVAGWCELRVRDGVAQIEDVEVLVEFRGLGLGRALVQRALEEGRRVADVVFLEALADDWPRELYAKLGFVSAGRRDFYTRLPHPFTRIRLRTPRLELRVATVADARRLLDVAPADVGDEEDFVSHVTRVSESQINFVAFVEGTPVGVQSLELNPERVTTTSWLGQAYLGQDLVTEMRAAALTYAFECAGATVARSDADELCRERFVSPVPVEVAGVR